MMKKTILMSVLLSCLMFSACSSDDDSTIKIPSINETPQICGEQIVKTVINHPGTVFYDSELKMWYIDYLRNRPAGSKERHYTDSSFQVEGQSVVFSGDAYDFLASKAEVPSGEYDYFIFLRDIDRCDHILPLSETASDIAEFFETATTIEEGMRCQIVFPESTLEEGLADTCFVINDQAQLTSLYTGQKTIPVIDFAKYTLVIGRAYMPNSGYSLTYYDISVNDRTLNLYIEEESSGFDAISFDYYWGLFPKFEGDGLTCFRNVTKMY